MSFKLIPAIDIIDGQLVRLHQGDYNKKLRMIRLLVIWLNNILIWGVIIYML